MISKIKELKTYGSEEGFTLIELMIVVVIIGILAAIAIPIFMNQQKTAIDAGLKSDVKNLTNSIVTTLVKAPTSTQICGVVTESIDAAGVTTPQGQVLYARVKVSDPATTIAVTNTAIAGNTATALNECGAWNDFAVTGYNPNGTFNTLAKGWSFNSKTGISKQL